MEGKKELKATIKRIIKIILILAIIILIADLINTHIYDTDAAGSTVDRTNGGVSYNSVIDANGDPKYLKDFNIGSTITINNNKYTTVFQNKNVFCIQKGTGLQRKDKGNVEYKIKKLCVVDEDSSDVMKGLAYIISYEGKGSSTDLNGHNNGDDATQIALWDYIDKHKSQIEGEFGCVVSGGGYKATGDAKKIFDIAEEIANGCLHNMHDDRILDSIVYDGNKVTGVPDELCHKEINGEDICWETLTIQYTFNGEEKSIELKRRLEKKSRGRKANI